MSMPNDLILTRHGESEGNVARRNERAGDTSIFTDGFVTTPGRRWELTDVGYAQSACVGSWLSGVTDQRTVELDPAPVRFYSSPFARATQTAAALGLATFRGRPVVWWVNRSLRERDWGDIETMPAAEFSNGAQTAANARRKLVDPLYWRPPGGESIADVAENRVRNFLDTLHRECANGFVVAVTHGEWLWAARLVLERADDVTFEAWERNPDARLRNCHVLHFSRINPTDQSVASHLAWLRAAYPQQLDGRWRMRVGQWHRVQFPTWVSVA